jgi:2-phosphosulfolactate phosphatase
MSRVHVLINKEHVDPRRLPGKVVIVLDVVFATTSIITALEHGATDVIPTVDAATALEEASRLAPDSFVLAGELDTETLPGFADPWPRALLARQLAGRTLVYSTTNGTVALNRASQGAHVYAGALVNGEALIRHVVAQHAQEPVLLLCAGSGANFNLEDFYGAGYLVSLLLAARHGYRVSDAALAATMFHERWEALECLRRARVGRIMAARNLDDEIAFAAQKSVFATVPRFAGGRVTRT